MPHRLGAYGGKIGPASSPQPTGHNMDVRALSDQYWDEILESDPLLATQVGDDRFDDRLPDLSPSGVECRRSVHSRAVEEARRLRGAASDLWERVICDTIEAIGAPEIVSIDLGLHRFAPIDQLWGPGTLLDQLATLQHVDTPDHIARYLNRLKAIDAYLTGAAALLAEDAGAPTAPRLIVDRCIRQVDDILATAPGDSPALRAIPAAETPSRSRVVEVLRSTVLPAYARYRATLGEYRARARDTIGLLDIPRGDEMYAACIRRWTSLGLEPAEIHEIGRGELANIESERLDVARALGAKDARTAIARRWATGKNRFSSRREIMRSARDQVERAWERARNFFGTLPAHNCEVRPVDPSREQDLLEHYLPGTRDGSRPPVYYVNTARPRERSRHSLAATTYHEATPGHHLQVSMEQAQADRPALLRLGGELAGSAFVEGWGLYAERLADEMGLYVDGYERLGMLELQAFRAARLVVDTGIHAFGWSRSQVIETLGSTGLDPSRSVVEADRYVAMPGQALAYKLGQIEIERHRRREEEALGNAFELPAFHDRVLALGSVPLTTFRRELSAASPGGGH
jgi:uncharacterized protein (DUF885 family)